MSQPVTTDNLPSQVSVSRKLDELATTLMIEGAGKIRPSDFTQLAEAARCEGQTNVAERAEAIAGELGKAGASTAEWTDAVSGWLDELRTFSMEEAASTAAEVLRSMPAEQPPLSMTSGLSAFSADVEMVREFVMEAREHLLAVEEKMLLLEQGGSDPEAIHAVFRGFHTIKGLAGFLEFGAIQEVAHEVETLLDLVRNSKLALSSEVVDAVFEGLDYVRAQIDGIQANLDEEGSEADADNHALLESIREICGRGEPIAEKQPEAAAGDARAAVDAVEASAVETRAAEVSPPLHSQSAGVQAVGGKASSAAVAVDSPARTAGPVAPAVAKSKPPVAEARLPKLASVKEERRFADTSSVRIETAKLDHLMNMVGEMVIAQTLISHNPEFSRIKDARLSADLGLLARITADVQKVTTSMRMVPIGGLFQKTARLIRDLSRQVGKQVVLETVGEDTELDKNIAEELSDPLMHMVRNSIDHGIETPEQRRLTAKDATARICLSAYHSSGQIVIEISDDGRGLDRERILAKAIERGIVKPGVQMADSEVFLLIFEAGFSTAEKVTGISGRGVGMDVVRKHVQKLRGRIEICSEPGAGTTFFIKLPLTLAIIEGLIVAVGESRYIVPIFSVTEMFRPEPSMISTVRGKAEMAMVRGNLLPVLRLHERFKLTPRSRLLTDGILIVAESQGRQFCLFVDSLMGKQEVVIKGLGETFKGVSGLAGCAILGDGRVGLILDIEGIYRGRY